MKIVVSTLIFSLLLCLSAATVFAQDEMTNDEVISLTKAGLSSSIIVGKIKTTKTNFDLSTDALIKLKQAGVIDHVPIWIPPSEIGMAQVSHARAIKTGLTFRPLATTIADTLAWWQTLPAERQAKVRAGLSPEQEAAGLKLR